MEAPLRLFSAAVSILVFHENGSLHGSSKLTKTKTDASLVTCTFVRPQGIF